MARGKVLAGASLVLLGLAGLGIKRVVLAPEDWATWKGFRRRRNIAGRTPAQNSTPRPDQVSTRALKESLAYPGGPIMEDARRITPTADLNAELTRRGGAGSLFDELGPQGVAELGRNPRYGGRDSGLGINGAEYENPDENVSVQRGGEQPPPIPEADKTRPTEVARTSVTAAGPSHPTEESNPPGPVTNRTGLPETPKTQEAAESAGDRDAHPGEGGGALGMKGAGVAAGGEDLPKLGRSQ